MNNTRNIARNADRGKTAFIGSLLVAAASNELRDARVTGTFRHIRDASRVLVGDNDKQFTVVPGNGRYHLFDTQSVHDLPPLDQARGVYDTPAQVFRACSGDGRWYPVAFGIASSRPDPLYITWNSIIHRGTAPLHAAATAIQSAERRRQARAFLRLSRNLAPGGSAYRRARNNFRAAQGR